MLKSIPTSFVAIVKKSAGWVLFIICSIAIYHKVMENEQWINVKQVFFAQLKAIGLLQWVILFVLMFLNLWTESVKWKIVVQKTNPIGILTALKSVFISQVFAFLTPSRVGEYAGRTMFLSSGNRILGIAQMAWTSYAQLLITIFIGSIAFILQLHYYAWLQSNWIVGIRFLVPVIPIFAFLLFFYKINWKGKFEFLNIIQIPTNTKINLLFWSFFRYFIFILQYIWLAYLLKMDMGYDILVLSLAILFFLLSILPTISITEWVVRGQLLIMLLAPFYTQKLTIVALSTIIWGINFLIPSIIGTILLIGFKIKK